MPSSQEQYDDAMFDFSMADYQQAKAKLTALLAEDPDHFEALLALGMTHCRLGDYDQAIAMGHKAEQLRPHEQLAHTNLSLFYLKQGDKARAEHHGLQARIASWKGNMAPPDPEAKTDPELKQAPAKAPPTLPEMPWKKKPAS